MRLLENKSAIITGAAKGIGEACARDFAKHGAGFLLIVDLDIAAAENTAASITAEYKTPCAAVKADVSSEADVVRVFEEFQRHAEKLDILLNCAGISRPAGIFDLDIKSWDLTMAVNLKGTFLFSREALRMMQNQRSGTIINMASQAGKSGGIMIGADYSASKGGILTLTKTFAKAAAAYNVTVNSVAPGLIATEMTKTYNYDPETVPLKRIGTPEEVADACLFLASGLSRYITGACIDVNGGISMW
jgi:3-oxoacyl-[acyl-carrier protein] reductase